MKHTKQWLALLLAVVMTAALIAVGSWLWRRNQSRIILQGG